MALVRLTAFVLALAFAQSAAAQVAPSYARHVRPFLAKYCLECHNTKVAKGGLELQSFKAVLEGGNRGEVLVAGDPDKSRLVLQTEGKAKPVMPPKTARFHPKAEEVAVLRAWVKAGAKDDSASIKVEVPDIKPRQERAAPVVALAFQPGGKLLAVARGKSVRWLDIASSAGPYMPMQAAVTALAFSADGKQLAVAQGSPGTAPGLLLRPAVHNGDPGVALPVLHQDAILEVAFSPDGKHIATASYDTTIRLISLAQAKPSASAAATLKEHSDAVYGLAFSPDGAMLASCGADRAVKVWDVATHKLSYTVGDATDWLYTLAWAPDGQHLAAGGVDKSIRVYRVGATGGKIVHSVFAHEAPVHKIVFSQDSKTLYSLGQDRVIKAWDAVKMVERKVFAPLPETGLALAVRDDVLAAGRFDGVVQVLDAVTGATRAEVRDSVQPKPAPPKAALQAKPQPKALQEQQGKQSKKDADPFPLVQAAEGNDSPGSGQQVKLPVSIAGKLDKAGDVDFFRFDAAKGQQLGIEIVTKAVGSKLEPVLQLTDRSGRVMAESSDGHLGYIFPAAGTYALGVRDREYRGGADMHYRLHLGPIPVVISLFPLGVQRGQEAAVRVKGVFLSSAADKDGFTVKVKAPAEAALGSKVAVPLPPTKSKPLGPTEIVVGEYVEVQPAPQKGTALEGTLPVPATANGSLDAPGQRDTWKFQAKKGQRLVVEVHARRLGSQLDSIVEVLDAKGEVVPRAVLRCQAKTFVTFRDHDSAQGNIRIETWGELAVNDFIYMNGELVKIQALPTHPDADCNFFTAGGQRLGFLDTTPMHHSLNEPMYKVTLHPPGAKFPPNGYPVFTLFHRNDDGGPGFGRDSRLFFDAPADGDYQVRISDARGQGGDNFGYRLTVRPPRPSFDVRFTPTAPAIANGSALPITITADRIDGYDGPIHVEFSELPAGWQAPPTFIEPGLSSTTVALFAQAVTPEKPRPIKMVAHAQIGGRKEAKEVVGGFAKLLEAEDIRCWTKQDEVSIKPGEQAKLTVHIERQKGFTGRVPLDVRGLPHGVRVLDLGLNGILITEKETQRTIVIYAEPWVEPMAHPFVVFAKREGKNTEHAAKSVLLKVVAK